MRPRPRPHLRQLRKSWHGPVPVGMPVRGGVRVHRRRPRRRSRRTHSGQRDPHRHRGSDTGPPQTCEQHVGPSRSVCQANSDGSTLPRGNAEPPRSSHHYHKLSSGREAQPDSSSVEAHTTLTPRLATPPTNHPEAQTQAAGTTKEVDRRWSRSRAHPSADSSEITGIRRRRVPWQAQPMAPEGGDSCPAARMLDGRHADQAPKRAWAEPARDPVIPEAWDVSNAS